jgi:hypothetical protein
MISTVSTVTKSGNLRLITARAPGADGLAAPTGRNPAATEVAVSPNDPPWQAAYEEYERRGGQQYVEAELQIPIPEERLSPSSPGALALGAPSCQQKPQSSAAPKGPERGWHLGAQYSQLASAREFAAANNTLGRPVRIAHVDTGYFNGHVSMPAHVLRELSYDFTVAPPKLQADDPGGFGPPLDNRGHGTATLAILAGGAIPLLGGRQLGGAPDAEILPLRVAENVVLIGIDALAKAVNYAIDHGCDVIALSMGGVASKFWADAYNRAYENGVFCVCAAGNHLKHPDNPDRHGLPGAVQSRDCRHRHHGGWRAVRSAGEDVRELGPA